MKTHNSLSRLTRGQCVYIACCYLTGLVWVLSNVFAMWYFSKFGAAWFGVGEPPHLSSALLGSLQVSLVFGGLGILVFGQKSAPLLISGLFSIIIGLLN